MLNKVLKLSYQTAIRNLRVFSSINKPEADYTVNLGGELDDESLYFRRLQELQNLRNTETVPHKDLGVDKKELEKLKPDQLVDTIEEKELARDVMTSKNMKEDVDRMGNEGGAQDQGSVKLKEKQNQDSVDQKSNLQGKKADIEQMRAIGVDKEGVEIDTNYDKYNLNKGAIDYEESNKVVKTTDTSFNSPKLVIQSNYRVGYENMTGRSFDPLVQGDPGEKIDLQAEAKERIKNDLVDRNAKGPDATKPIQQTIKYGLFDSNPRTS
ncbi:UNKNOWN [Stylonychia lemnae]|uniref:Uncharacterized protein n=1 Tax=Stylonychia lemnae TaxID=5949 RepID=A0A077ZYK8_STYLE|nr:UNKNOWN [Stylonychia lemnae]|eukprot:CDW74970.1 UNKNOWN [Stylonychia lemnae]